MKHSKKLPKQGFTHPLSLGMLVSLFLFLILSASSISGMECRISTHGDQVNSIPTFLLIQGEADPGQRPLVWSKPDPIDTNEANLAYAFRHRGLYHRLTQIILFLFPEIAPGNENVVKIACDPWPPWMEGSEGRHPGEDTERIPGATMTVDNPGKQQRANRFHADGPDMSAYPVNRC
ncbi:MAG: hypothetical protein GY737_16520 [Desulfobacteraceae bacterium]|nr:hypothetical protein [Desulfobacteraceae bacterium]